MRSVWLDRKFPAEFDDAVAPVLVVGVDHGHPAAAYLGAPLPLLVDAIFHLEEVREIGAVFDLDRHRLRAVTMVLDDHVLVDAARDEPVAPDRDWRVLTDADVVRRREDRRRIIVDGSAGQDMDR